MGVYDEIKVPCPKCGTFYIAQSKGGNPILMRIYDLHTAPMDVLMDVNRHAPFTCEHCGTRFYVNIEVMGRSVFYNSETDKDKFIY